jgi:hypothetical protein
MFTTKIDTQPSAYKIDYSSRILTVGSCFSENMGTKLQNACFDTDVNPFGVLFNPASIAESIQLLMQKRNFTTDDLFQHNSLWGNYMHSTLFSDSKPEHCLSKINTRLNAAAENMQKLDFLMLTFGTAWVYKLAETGKVVANCHKVPADKFIRDRLTVEAITNIYNNLITELKRVNPDLKIVFTVSPVRHWKDGPTENAISKGILLQAIQEIVKTHKNTCYFPAYEILMDELRDYRFYAADMLHPSEVAVDYIFKIFSNVFFQKETLQCMNELTNYKNGLLHRPTHTDTTEYEKFKNHLHKTKQNLLNKYPVLAGRI